MTILVDRPRWWWRGTRWSHLVSDTDLAELHRFARRVRLRYLSFQGDHYDVPEARFVEVVEAGASVVDSRELVRRLVGSGLRRRGGKRLTAWQVASAGALAEVTAGLEPARGRLLADVARRHGPVTRATLLVRPGEVVGLLEVPDVGVRLEAAVMVVDADCAVVEAHDPGGHTVEVVWRSGAGRELDHR